MLAFYIGSKKSDKRAKFHLDYFWLIWTIFMFIKTSSRSGRPRNNTYFYAMFMLILTTSRITQPPKHVLSAALGPEIAWIYLLTLKKYIKYSFPFWTFVVLPFVAFLTICRLTLGQTSCLSERVFKLIPGIPHSFMFTSIMSLQITGFSCHIITFPTGIFFLSFFLSLYSFLVSFVEGKEDLLQSWQFRVKIELIKYKPQVSIWFGIFNKI